MVQPDKLLVIASPPETVHHLIAALEACARYDIYWSNEFFYRWVTAALDGPDGGRPCGRSRRAMARRPGEISSRRRIRLGG